MAYTILPGLPPYGPMAQTFGGPGYREGLVVAFETNKGEWIVNFHGHSTKFTKIVSHPDGKQIIVITNGCGYIVDPTARSVSNTHVHGDITFVEPLPNLNALLIGSALEFETLRSDGFWWRSPRISWDGFRNLVVDGNVLRGDAYTPMMGENNCWHPFTLNLLTGECRNGIYQKEMSRAIRIVPPKS